MAASIISPAKNLLSNFNLQQLHQGFSCHSANYRSSYLFMLLQDYILSQGTFVIIGYMYKLLDIHCIVWWSFNAEVFLPWQVEYFPDCWNDFVQFPNFTKYCGNGVWNKGNEVRLISNVFSPKFCCKYANILNSIPSDTPAMELNTPVMYILSPTFFGEK